jgi:hypothetical protein
MDRGRWREFAPPHCRKAPAGHNRGDAAVQRDALRLPASEPPPMLATLIETG